MAVFKDKVWAMNDNWNDKYWHMEDSMAYFKMPS